MEHFEHFLMMFVGVVGVGCILLYWLKLTLSKTNDPIQELVNVSNLITPKKTTILEWPNGSLEYYRDGKLHREDGPAVIMDDGTKLWFKNGRLHRIGSPAVERSDGTTEWWEDGNCLKNKI